jgi:DNA repair exonuclease SbcCD ATPase subunit
MIKFKKARAKNFLSIGNYFLDYDLDASNLVLLKGKNGGAKSTINDILTFALFKKAYRPVNLPQLVNNINKGDCLVEVEFQVNKTEWKVRRGLSPNIFEIYKNNKLLDQHSSVIEQQRWLEQNVLKMNYKTFTQIILLGTSNFIPFMQLTPADRREIIEELLDIKVFSSMSSIVKETIKELKDEIKLLKVKQINIEEKIDLQKNFINQIQVKKSANIQEKKDKIVKYSNAIKELSGEEFAYEEYVQKLTQDLKEYSKASSQLKKLGDLKGKISQKMSFIKDNHSFFSDNDVCPTCSQVISEDFKQQKLEESKSKIEELSSGYQELLNTIKKEEEKEQNFIDLSRKINSINQKINEIQSKISQYNSIISDIQKEIEDANSSEDEEGEKIKLQGFIEELSSLKDTIIEYKEKQQYYDFVNGLLKDGGVKTSIINKYLPLINKKVNEYLQKMDLFVNFTLDGEFNETILTPSFENFSYGNFSEGQKQRINLALTFGLMAVAAVKNSVNTNLLILDEILDGSMDAEGISMFLSIIKTEMKDKNIFMISHRDGLDDKFDSIFYLEKKGQFSYKTEIV